MGNVNIEISKESLKDNFKKKAIKNELDNTIAFNSKVQKLINEISNEIVEANSKGETSLKLKIGYTREINNRLALYKDYGSKEKIYDYKLLKNKCIHNIFGHKVEYNVAHLYSMVREFNKVGINCKLRRVKYTYENPYPSSSVVFSAYMFIGYTLDFSWE